MSENRLDLSRCISIDLEISKKDNKITAIGAVRTDNSGNLHHRSGGLRAGLSKLDQLADGATFVLGHNIRNFDLIHLRAAKPNLRLLKLPTIDTLYLSPLAFPRNPYHKLVKHYQDGALRSDQLNNPEHDAQLALALFTDQKAALSVAEKQYLTAWHWLATPDHDGSDHALDALFTELRGARRPQNVDAVKAIEQVFHSSVCSTEGRRIIEFLNKDRSSVQKAGWQLAFVIAWLSVAGGNSVLPPWVRHQFPDTRRLLSRLRDAACSNPSCSWCREHHNAKRQLQRWFQFSDFRSKPDVDGQSMQQSIVEASMAGKHVLGVMPTGTGKSICYQVPALARYYNTGALTIVISPLVALMADQVEGLAKKGIDCCFTINSLLSMPERSDVLEKVRLGDTGILLISPEQLRSRTFRQVINQREIGMWVLDEAHCLSRWGHDFRPDYRYVGRFIREKAGDQSILPVLCLTATAKPEVVDDISRYFSNKLDVDLRVFNGGAERNNLEFTIIPTTADKKFSDVLQVLQSYLPNTQPGGAIIYCATRKQTEEIAEYLQLRDISAKHFHAMLPPESKKMVQQEFIEGQLRVITATNAFGMGIDKPDVRLVIHADIPGSLENYLQEAGRGGRDNDVAHCVLLYDGDDVERQFSMSARSRLNRAEIHGILRALRKLNRRFRFKEEVVATPGEILLEDEDHAFRRDSTGDDTRVRTAVAWLEEAKLLTREENVVQIFPSSLRVGSIEEAVRKLQGAKFSDSKRSALLSIIELLLAADRDEGVSTDELMMTSKLSSEEVRHALADLEQLGIASNDMAITAYVHTGVGHSSVKRLEQAIKLEQALINCLRESAPDVSVGESWRLHLRVVSQQLRNEGLPDPLPERLLRLVRSLGQDGRGEDGSGKGSLAVRKLDSEFAQVTLLREWQALDKKAQVRRDAASCLAQHFLEQLPSEVKGVDLLAETTIGKLLQAIKSDIAVISNAVQNHQKLLDRSLLWLHEQEIIRLNKGLTVLRPAMLIRMEERGSTGFSKTDFEPLALHYQGQVLQVHVMQEYAERGVASVSDALRMAMDYFTLKEPEFLNRWLPDRGSELDRQTTPESWQQIVENLNDSVQQRIVRDDRVQTNVLVLAGPGSGKTRVLVHRIAYLVRMQRENPRSIVALVYNRHAAVEIRRRLADLIGKDSFGVTVLTCHALAMRLVGMTFAGLNEQPDDKVFREVLVQATSLLRGQDMPSEVEADEQRERLLGGYRWILVDEYQDIGGEEYELISGLAGRTQTNPSSKLTMFAVGDDDQNIYSFKGASVEFIRRFESDYKAKPISLTANYRSTKHIISASNALIAPARNRMKAEYPIEIDRSRSKEPAGGEWAELDPLSQGRVQILSVSGGIENQSYAVVSELLRLRQCSKDWRWDKCAVIAREWKHLQPIRSLCEAEEIPVQMGDEEVPKFWRIRETYLFIDRLRNLNQQDVKLDTMRKWCKQQPSNRWIEAILEAINEFKLESDTVEVSIVHFIEWLAEWGQEYRRRQQGLLLISAHRAKGLEFDHLVILDGGWGRINVDEDPDVSRRLYYVAMTRARKTLAMIMTDKNHPFTEDLKDNASVLCREVATGVVNSTSFQMRYIQPGLDEIDIGFSGRYHKNHKVHKSIAALSVGDPLTPRINRKGRLELQNSDGLVVARLAKKFVLPSGMRCQKAEVLAVIRWNNKNSDEAYKERSRCESWEVIVPQLVFEQAS